MARTWRRLACGCGSGRQRSLALEPSLGTARGASLTRCGPVDGWMQGERDRVVRFIPEQGQLPEEGEQWVRTSKQWTRAAERGLRRSATCVSAGVFVPFCFREGTWMVGGLFCLDGQGYGRIFYILIFFN